MLNAIEEAFSCMKYAIKSKMSELRDELYSTDIPSSQGLTIMQHRRNLLERVADEVITSSLITHHKCYQWDQYILRYIPLCLERRDIDE